MPRLMRWVAALAVAALLPAAAAAGAGAGDKETAWRVSATVTGTYENTVGWVNCPLTGEPALIHERVVVNAKLEPRFTAVFTRSSGLVARFRATAGGTWSLTGSYPPIVESPTGGDFTCAAQVPVSCAGPVIGHDRHASIDFIVRGRRAIGYFSDFAEIVESGVYAVPDPAKPFCSQSDDEPTRVVPLYGLGSTSLAARAAPTPDTFPAYIPVAKLLGHKRFSVLLRPAALEGCPTDYYTPCEESGQIRMRLTFRPTAVPRR